MHAPHHVWPEWADQYKGKFDMGWDKYREQMLARQKELGIVPDARRARRRCSRACRVGRPVGRREAPVRAHGRGLRRLHGAHRRADRPAARLPRGDRRSSTTRCVFVFIGDNGSSGEGTLNGLFNEQCRSSPATARETLEQNLARIDQLGQPGSYNHYPVGWALAGNTPFKLCKQYTHFGGTRNPLVVHWPDGIKAKGELRHQFHHVHRHRPDDPRGARRRGRRGSSTACSRRRSRASRCTTPSTPPTRRRRTRTQYFEMLGNRGLVHDGWKVVTYHGRKPWENAAAWGFDDDHWELYDLDRGPGRVPRPDGGPRPRRTSTTRWSRSCIELVTLWWAEAGKYQVLPLDDRFQARALDREALYARTARPTFYEGAVRIQPFEAPQRSTAPGR